jgi:enoyl-CoA hydratase/carnithine racemase
MSGDDTIVFRYVEVTMGMLPIAGCAAATVRTVGRARESRFSMLESRSREPKSALGIATHVGPEARLAETAAALAKRLASGTTSAYAVTRTLLKAWSSGGVFLNTTFTETTNSRSCEGAPRAIVHPDDASRAGIVDDDVVLIWESARPTPAFGKDCQ